MEYKDNTPMPDILAGMQIADPDAAAAFVACQSADNLRPLLRGAQALADVTFSLQLTRVDELMAWKTPDNNVPVPLDALRAALDGAAGGDQGELKRVLTPLPFRDLVTLRSLADFLAGSAKRTLALHYSATD